MKHFFLVGCMALLSACQHTSSQPLKVHEVDLYSANGNHKIAWVYGGKGTSHVRLDGQNHELKAAVAATDLTVQDASQIAGNAVYTKKISAYAGPLPVLDGMNTQIFINQNGRWNNAKTGANSLYGVGQLTHQEADVLERWLHKQGAVAVAVLNSTGPLLSVEPTAEQKQTSLYVFYDMPNMTTTSSTSLQQASSVRWDKVASGNNASSTMPQHFVASNDNEAALMYQIAYGRQSNVPGIQPVGSDTFIGLFAGEFTTGGYRIAIDHVHVSGDVLEVTSRIDSPKEGMITTQAFTSPWMIIRVPGKYREVKVLHEGDRPNTPFNHR